MLKYADMFYEFVAYDVIDFDESYKSYVTNIFNGKIWGDDLMASAIVHMFNIPISIVSPEMRTVDLFHNVTPQIVIKLQMGEALYPENQPLILARHVLPSEGFNCLVLEH